MRARGSECLRKSPRVINDTKPSAPIRHRGRRDHARADHRRDRVGRLSTADRQTCAAPVRRNGQSEEGKISTPNMTEKQMAIEALRCLPDDATLDDAIERLCCVAKIQRGLRKSDARQLVSLDNVKKSIVVRRHNP